MINMFQMIFLSFVTFILVDLCCAVETVQSNENNTSNLTLMTKLLELHQYHCDNTATCGSSEHQEPSQFYIPVPCCKPCSCLPSCVKKQNCCPFSVNGTITIPTTAGLDDDPRAEENQTDDGLVFVRNEIVNWNTTDQTDKAEKHEIETDRIENGTEPNAMDSAFSKLNKIDAEHEKCVRPQALYRPNRFIDSQAYMMVTDCPDKFKDTLMVDKCNAKVDVPLLDMIPVTSKLSGLTYKNKHCLACNEKLLPEHKIEWTAEIVSNGARRRHIFFPNPDKIVAKLKEIRPAFSNLHFTPVDDALARRCNVYDVISCNQTGLWDNYDKLIEKVCLDGYQLPITNKVDGQMLTFKNIGCLHCNVESDSKDNRLFCGYWYNPLWAQSSFRVTLNLGSTFVSDPFRKTPLPAPYVEQGVLQLLQQRRCRAGTLYLQGRCRRIICPKDHYAKENKCVPLYDTVKGLDLNIQIEITPSQAIPDDILDAFVDDLKASASGVLKDEVGLERRQVSLWYLPRSKANPTQYYLLDVFLFSPSNAIVYSTAVEQIKQFIVKLNTRVNLDILKPVNTKLFFRLKHGLDLQSNKYVDMSNGKTLKPLMEKGWTLETPGPYMTISEVNWCFRAAFDLWEIEDFRVYIIVKFTDIIVFIDEFDVEQDQIYLCVDLFVDKMREPNELVPVIQDQTTGPSDEDNTLTEEIVTDVERGLILTVTMISLILLLVILYRVKIAKVKHQVEESARSDQPPDFLELKVINNRDSLGNKGVNDIDTEKNTASNIAQDSETGVDNKTQTNMSSQSNARHVIES